MQSCSQLRVTCALHACVLQAFSCMLLLTKNRSVTSYRMLAFRVVFEYLQVCGSRADVLAAPHRTLDALAGLRTTASIRTAQQTSTTVLGLMQRLCNLHTAPINSGLTDDSNRREGRLHTTPDTVSSTVAVAKHDNACCIVSAGVSMRCAYLNSEGAGAVRSLTRKVLDYLAPSAIQQ